MILLIKLSTFIGYQLFPLGYRLVGHRLELFGVPLDDKGSRGGGSSTS